MTSLPRVVGKARAVTILPRLMSEEEREAKSQRPSTTPDAGAEARPTPVSQPPRSERGAPASHDQSAEAARAGEVNRDGMGEDETEAAPMDAEPADPLAEAQAEAAKLRDQLLRTAADFDNFRKRSRREMEETQRKAREDMLRELLPIFDNLERAAEHAKSATDVQALSQGIDLVMRQFVDTLGRLQVERVATVGQPFDPSLHEAIQHLETTEYPAGAVAHEVQAGYRVGERLVRPALVVVAKAPSGSADGAGETN